MRLSLTKTYLFFDSKLILMKIPLFIKRCRDANGKIIRMTEFVLFSHSVLSTIGSRDWFSSQSKAIGPDSAFLTGTQLMLQSKSAAAEESCCGTIDVTGLTSWHLVHREEVLVAS